MRCAICSKQQPASRAYYTGGVGRLDDQSLPTAESRRSDSVSASRPLRTTISRPTAAENGRAVQVTVTAPVRDRAGHLLGTLAGNLNLDRSDVSGPIAAAAMT